MINQRHYLIYGTGSIGGMIGCLLANNGQQVTFLARAPLAAHLKRHGISLTYDSQRSTFAKPQVVTSPEDALLARPDVVVFAVKSYDTAKAVAELHMASNPEAPIPAILCLQNGIDNESALSAAFGDDKIISGTITTAVSTRTTGEIIIDKRRGVGLATNHPLSEVIAADFQRAGMAVELYDNPAAMKWSKLLTNMVANATSAICDLPAGKVFADKELYKIEIEALREAVAVMDALHIPVVKLPGVPVTLMVFALRYLPAWLYRVYFVRMVAGGRGDKMPSFHVDLSRNRKRSEVNWINGAVVRHGQRAGVPTPVNAALTDILKTIASDPKHWGEYQERPNKLVAAVRGHQPR